ncbi:MAG TPA: hypothetical protein VJX67_07855, partial [Blastocatellia bacterium]|nr:hypothetical protein [Blastocatellia bacterium]
SAGIGSYSSGRLKIEPGRLIKIVAITLCLTVIGWLGLSAYLFHLFIGSSLAVRFLVTVALQAPLGLLLGMFFPLGIRLVHQADERMIPWVWAANGLSSVVGTVVAILLAMSFGFRWVTFAAAGIYIVGTLSISLTGKRTVESGQTSTNLDSDGEPAHSVLVPVQPDNLGV